MRQSKPEGKERGAWAVRLKIKYHAPPFHGASLHVQGDGVKDHSSPSCFETAASPPPRHEETFNPIPLTALWVCEAAISRRFFSVRLQLRPDVARRRDHVRSSAVS